MSEVPALPPPEVWKASEKEQVQKHSDQELLRVSRPLTRLAGVLVFLFIIIWWLHSTGMVLLGNSNVGDAISTAEGLLLGVIVVLFGLNLLHGLRVQRALRLALQRVDEAEAPEGMYIMVPVEPSPPGAPAPPSRTGTRDLGQYEVRPLPRKSPTGTRALNVEEAP